MPIFKLRTVQTQSEKGSFSIELNQYECIKEGSNKAILLFKGEKTIAKLHQIQLSEVSAIAKTVHYENNAAEKH
jgi:hypothetical protein